MKKNDLILFAIVVLVSIAALIGINLSRGGASADAQVLIKDDGVMIKSYPFNEKTDEVFTFEEDDEINVVEIKNGIVTVTEANCRDQICVKTQSISRNGEIIVCLPHKFTVEIYSEDADEDALDSIVD